VRRNAWLLSSSNWDGRCSGSDEPRKRYSRTSHAGQGAADPVSEPAAAECNMADLSGPRWNLLGSAET
jgi:hypothetical protein